MKTFELIGSALDWAVAKITNPEWWDDGYMAGDPIAALEMDDGSVYSPSTDWAQGGPIIERQEIELRRWALDGWMARDTNYAFLNTPDERAVFAEGHGPTPLIAAMRCYVASRLGDEVQVPEGLK